MTSEVKQLPLVSVNLIVRNGEKYIRQCLRHVFDQTYPNIEVLVFDNNSQDATREIVKRFYPKAYLILNSINYGLGGGFNRSVSHTNKFARYVMLLCVDVLLDEHFIEHAVEAFEKYPMVGGLQGKVYQLDWSARRKTGIIDTCGLEISRARRVAMIGHGEQDTGQYDAAAEVFSYEGACPVFRREALNASKFQLLNSKFEFLDEDFVWYGDDLDLGWRMRLLGWPSIYIPTMLAWHDRQTTKRLSKSLLDFIRLRRDIPAMKRRLDFQNQRLAFIKNDFVSHLLRDVARIAMRELGLFLYFVFFERSSLLAYFGIMKRLPRMLLKRRWILQHRKVSASDMRYWFDHSTRSLKSEV